MTPRFVSSKIRFKGFNNSDATEQMINIPKQLSCVLQGKQDYTKHTGFNFNYIHINIFKVRTFLKIIEYSNV